MKYETSAAAAIARAISAIGTAIGKAEAIQGGAASPQTVIDLRGTMLSVKASGLQALWWKANHSAAFDAAVSGHPAAPADFAVAFLDAQAAAQAWYAIARPKIDAGALDQPVREAGSGEAWVWQRQESVTPASIATEFGGAVLGDLIDKLRAAGGLVSVPSSFDEAEAAAILASVSGS